MSERERDRAPQADFACPEGADQEQHPVARTGDELLAAADEALRRALSADSEAFLRECRQEGGE
jgi:hypothetical protein